MALQGWFSFYRCLQVLTCTGLRLLRLEKFDGLDQQHRFSDLRHLKVLGCNDLCVDGLAKL